MDLIKQIIKDIAEHAVNIKPGELQDDDYAYYEQQLISALANSSNEGSGLHKHGVTNRTCSFCGGTDFETTESQYNDVDNDYDRCEITYCTKCRNTYSIDV